MSSAAMAVRAFYNSLLAGEQTGPVLMFGGPPKIDTPLDGNIEGSASFQRFAIDQRSWLAERQAEVEEVSLSETDQRAVAEVILKLKQNGDAVSLPVVLVADLAGGMVTWLRIYHSTWPLTGTHRVRGPMLKRNTRLGAPETIKTYLSCLRKPDKDKALSLFSDEAYVREPSGDQFKHAGSSALDEFYSIALANGGIPLKGCSATFDGTHCAIEYNCDAWGSATLPPQAGCSVYELNDENQIVAVRIYDDLTPPSEKSS